MPYDISCNSRFFISTSNIKVGAVGGLNLQNGAENANSTDDDGSDHVK